MEFINLQRLENIRLENGIFTPVSGYNLFILPQQFQVYLLIPDSHQSNTNKMSCHGG